MKCEQVRDLIAAEYIDDEAEDTVRQEVDGHLKTCDPCAQFLEDIRQRAVQPFKGAGELIPPAGIWAGIQAGIAGRRSKSLRGILTDWMRSFRFRRPVIAAAACLVIAAGVFLTRPPDDQGDTVNGYLEEQMDFLYIDDAEDLNGSLGTGIEEFLM